ncbi:MAG: hypothetical protein ACK46Y_08660 [Fluviicola sp.]|jgi:hypothetical protein
MKQITLIFLLLVLVACGKPDNEAVLGGWKFKEMYQDGKLVSTVDKAKQEKLIDSIIEVQGAMFEQQGMSKDFIRQQIKMGFDQVAKVTFLFDKKELKFEVPENKEKISIGTYKLNDKTKKMTFDEKKDPFFSGDLTYELTDDQLILKSAKEKMVLTRKTK